MCGVLRCSARARAHTHTHTHITYIHIHSVIRGPTTDMALLSAAAEDNSLKKKSHLYSDFL
jgi:hypothetical protein